MRYALTLVTLILGAVVSAAPPSQQNDAFNEFANGNRIFTARAYTELIKEQKGNIIMSPFSAEAVLAMTYEGARGQTAKEFETGLSLPSTKSKTQEAFKNFLPKLRSTTDDLKLLSANKIYAAHNVKLEPSFLEVAENVYNSGVENINFEQNTEAARTINGWVESQTNNKIQDLIDPDSIDSSTRLVLVNALYFSGKWKYPFYPHSTTPAKFYKEDSSVVEVDTMHQTETFNYCENPSLGAKFLELPYEGEDVSMVIVLPNERDGLKSLEANIEEVLKPQKCSRERVEVSLPKFTIHTTIPFIPILKRLGITQAFGRDSDLSGLSSTDKNLVISEVIQKAFINVTEAGTEAAAATAVGTSRSAHHLIIDENKIFNADHPFIFTIYKNGVNIFVGSFKSN